MNQTPVGSKTDKIGVTKKSDDATYSHSGSRGNVVPVNRGKPQVNAQATSKPTNQSVSAKPLGNNIKPTSTLNQSQAPVSRLFISSISMT